MSVESEIIKDLYIILNRAKECITTKDTDSNAITPAYIDAALFLINSYFKWKDDQNEIMENDNDGA